MWATFYLTYLLQDYYRPRCITGLAYLPLFAYSFFSPNDALVLLVPLG